MEITNYKPGIYSLGEVEVSKKHGLVVAVHPYFLGNNMSQIYRENLRDILCDENRAVLIMEEESKLVDRLRYLEEDLNGISKNRFVVKTKSKNPTPRLTSMNELFHFASGFRQPLSFVGGRFYEHEENGDSNWEGCLAIVYQSFLEAGFNGNVLKKVTFK